MCYCFVLFCFVLFLFLFFVFFFLKSLTCSLQATLGESKKDKGSEPVVLYLTVGGQKFVSATLSKDKVPQISFDLVLDQDFELSHNWKNGSVYFMGYKTQSGEEYPSSHICLFIFLI